MAGFEHRRPNGTFSSAVVAIVGLVLVSGCTRVPQAGTGNGQAASPQVNQPVGDDDDTLASLAPAALRDQANTHLQIRYATALAAAARNEEALKVARAAYDRDKDEPNAGLLVARLYIRLGDGPAARAAYQDVLSRSPDNVRSLNGLGIAYVMEDMLSTAEATFRRAVTLSPSDAGSRSNLALALALEGKTTEAIPMLEAQLSQEPVSDRDRTNLALAYAIAGSREKAVQLLMPRMTAAGANSFVDAYAPHGAPSAERVVLQMPPRTATTR